MLRRVVIPLVMILSFSLAFGNIIQSSMAQVDSVELSKQTTLSGDLQNNPIAQDILEKIEQTKQWILDLENREYERTQAQQELEEKREIALERLNQDLLDWENLWSNYTSRAAFERFVEDKPPQIQGVFWDQFEFKEMKVKAGRDALKEVIANDGSLSEARAAYHKAAETKRIELIEMNAQFNVNHNLAYYKQQLLFNSTGQITLTNYTKSKLAEYYTDYRSDPEYLLANPNDKYAYESLLTDRNTQCREGYIVVYRIPSSDYTCVTESTAEMWERHGIGEIVDPNEVIFDENSLTPAVKTNPSTKCIDGHIVIYIYDTEEYECVLESFAKTWIDEGTAEIHDLTQFILEKDTQKEIDNQVFDLNQEINDLYDLHTIDQIQLKKKYDLMYKEADELTKQEEQNLQKKYYSSEDMTKDQLAILIMELRENNESNKEQILKDKSQALEDLNMEMHKKMQEMAGEFKNNSKIKLVWNSDDSKYQAEKR